MLILSGEGTWRKRRGACCAGEKAPELEPVADVFAQVVPVSKPKKSSLGSVSAMAADWKLKQGNDR